MSTVLTHFFIYKFILNIPVTSGRGCYNYVSIILSFRVFLKLKCSVTYRYAEQQE